MSQEQEPIEGISDGERAIYDYAQTSPTAANDPEVKKVVEKVEAYNAKFKAYPDTIVFDSVSKIFDTIHANCNEKFKGFGIL